jgi:Fe-S-cluster-containing hydrogenase component 2
MAKQVNPTAELEPRANDIALPDEWMLKLSLFAGLKEPPSLYKFPGSVVVRHYTPGDVIYRQGEGGGTAFYILLPQDRSILREGPKARLESLPALMSAKRERVRAAERERVELEKRTGEQPTEAAAIKKPLDALKKELDKLCKELGGLESEQATLPGLVSRLEHAIAANPGATPAAPAEVAIVHLAYPSAGKPSSSLWKSLQRVLGGRRSSAATRPIQHASDGPVNLDFQTRQATFKEGDWFGEMSCLNRTPRAGTVVVTRECFMVELMRNIFDALQKDPEFRKRTAELYRERTLRSQLRALPVFAALDDHLLERLRTQAELVDFEPGTLIFDEHEQSDCMHVIRNGVVKVMKGASFLVSKNDVSDMAKLRDELATSAPTLLESAPAEMASVVLNEWIRQPEFHHRAEFRTLLTRSQIPQRVWELLADPACAGQDGMLRCNRVLLEGIAGGQLHECKPDGDASDPVLGPQDIKSWKDFVENVFLRDKPTDREGPARKIVRKHVEADLGALKSGQEPAPEVKSALLHALNQLLRRQPWLLWREFSEQVLSEEKLAGKLMAFMPRRRQWSEYDFQRANRAANRFLLEALLPTTLRPVQVSTAPPLVISYSSRGETLGEIGVMEQSTRSATCVAYNHPDDDPGRKVGPVQMVRISRGLFAELQSASGPFRAAVAEAVAAHKARDVRRAEAPLAQKTTALLETGRALELGLIQGQKLMLIDLERCTRCDECVHACVATHDDHRSRLFLDGPRFGKYLVPTTCRSCLDPVCMIECPVSSIRRGDNRQMVIEPWCIGCGKCADQCPYEAIQMHDIGIIPEDSPGWRVLVTSKPPQGWEQPRFRDGVWQSATAPFLDGRAWRDLRRTAAITHVGNRPGTTEGSLALFRYEFRLDADRIRKEGHLRITLASVDAAAALWANGQALTAAESRRGTQEFVIAQKGGSVSPLRAGMNLLAVRVQLGQPGETVMSLRLDYIERPKLQFSLPEEVTQKPVTKQAVVCDLCSSISGGPACVRACPHDAALRINSRLEFPRG